MGRSSIKSINEYILNGCRVIIVGEIHTHDPEPRPNIVDVFFQTVPSNDIVILLEHEGRSYNSEKMYMLGKYYNLPTYVINNRGLLTSHEIRNELYYKNKLKITDGIEITTNIIKEYELAINKLGNLPEEAFSNLEFAYKMLNELHEMNKNNSENKVTINDVKDDMRELMMQFMDIHLFFYIKNMCKTFILIGEEHANHLKHGLMKQFWYKSYTPVVQNIDENLYNYLKIEQYLYKDRDRRTVKPVSPQLMRLYGRKKSKKSKKSKKTKKSNKK